MRAIESCRTAALGGHVEKCDRCGFERISYNSCRNRHCPKCQAMAKAAWLQQRKAELLPVGYFHTVFTLPHELNIIALANKEVIFNLLFKSAADTLQEFAADPEHGLGGRLGLTAILHTWDQKLCSHIHLHCVIPDTGRSAFEKQHTVGPCQRYFPVSRQSIVTSLSRQVY
jgi:hypothetical protein